MATAIHDVSSAGKCSLEKQLLNVTNRFLRLLCVILLFYYTARDCRNHNCFSYLQIKIKAAGISGNIDLNSSLLERGLKTLQSFFSCLSLIHVRLMNMAGFSCIMQIHLK